MSVLNESGYYLMQYNGFFNFKNKMPYIKKVKLIEYTIKKNAKQKWIKFYKFC